MNYNENQILTFNGGRYYPFADITITLSKFHITLNASENFEIENVECYGMLPRQKLLLLGFAEECTELPVKIESSSTEQIDRIRSHYETETNLEYPIGDDVYGHLRIRMSENPYYKNGGKLVSGIGQLILEDSIFCKVLMLIKNRNISKIHINAMFNNLYFNRPDLTDKNFRLLEADDFPSQEIYLSNDNEWPERAHGLSNGLITQLSVDTFDSSN